jgi:hypothetical protein
LNQNMLYSFIHSFTENVLLSGSLPDMFIKAISKHNLEPSLIAKCSIYRHVLEIFLNFQKFQNAPFQVVFRDDHKFYLQKGDNQEDPLLI